MMAFSRSFTATAWQSQSPSVPPPLAPPTPPRRISVELQAIASDMVAKLLELPDGWDSYRAPPPSTRAVAGAVLVAALVDHDRPDLIDELQFAPSLDGGVALSLEVGTRSIDITVNNRGSFRVEYGDVDQEAPVTDSPMAAMKLVARGLKWLTAT